MNCLSHVYLPSEQWFIQARRYATKREKPLSVPDKRRVSGQWPDKEDFLTQQMTYKY